MENQNEKPEFKITSLIFTPKRQKFYEDHEPFLVFGVIVYCQFGRIRLRFPDNKQPKRLERSTRISRYLREENILEYSWKNVDLKPIRFI